MFVCFYIIDVQNPLTMPIALPLIDENPAKVYSEAQSIKTNSSPHIEKNQFHEENNVQEGASTRGPSVIFPSVENKPIVANSTFSYQLGKTKSGVEVIHTFTLI